MKLPVGKKKKSMENVRGPQGESGEANKDCTLEIPNIYVVGIKRLTETFLYLRTIRLFNHKI